MLWEQWEGRRDVHKKKSHDVTFNTAKRVRGTERREKEHLSILPFL